MHLDVENGVIAGLLAASERDEVQNNREEMSRPTAMHFTREQS